jgi:hypothetical protein
MDKRMVRRAEPCKIMIWSEPKIIVKIPSAFRAELQSKRKDMVRVRYHAIFPANSAWLLFAWVKRAPRRPHPLAHFHSAAVL